MVRIKICCIASIDEAGMAMAAGASALGLVSEMPSGPGPIADDEIRRIAAWCPPGVSSFLLTSRTEPDSIIAHMRHCNTNTVQLVDAVPAGTYGLLRRELPGVKIVQVIHVQDAAALDEARACAADVDAVLLDSGNPRGAVKELGGTGRAHDWEISKRIAAEIPCPVFLAGGLRPDNVAEAIATVRPFGVDVCTGVRTGGRLDSEKLTRFVDAAGAA